MSKPIKSSIVLSAAMLLLMALGHGTPVMAQDQAAEQPKAEAAGKTKSEKFGTWTVICSTEEKNRCVAQQQLASNKNKQVIAAAMVRLGKEGGAEFTVQLPPGVVIAPGVTLTVDDKELAKAPFFACAPRGCEASFKIDQNLINGLAKGKALSASVTSLRGKVVAIQFKLDGFVKAYAAFKKGVTN